MEEIEQKASGAQERIGRKRAGLKDYLDSAPPISMRWRSLRYALAKSRWKVVAEDLGKIHNAGTVRDGGPRSNSLLSLQSQPHSRDNDAIRRSFRDFRPNGLSAGRLSRRVDRGAWGLFEGTNIPRLRRELAQRPDREPTSFKESALHRVLQGSRRYEALTSGLHTRSASTTGNSYASRQQQALTRSANEIYPAEEALAPDQPRRIANSALKAMARQGTRTSTSSAPRSDSAAQGGANNQTTIALGDAAVLVTPRSDAKALVRRNPGTDVNLRQDGKRGVSRFDEVGALAPRRGGSPDPLMLPRLGSNVRSTERRPRATNPAGLSRARRAQSDSAAIVVNHSPTIVINQVRSTDDLERQVMAVVSRSGYELADILEREAARRARTTF